MSSRDHILKAIRQNRPDPVEQPSLPSFERPGENLKELFISVLASVGGTCLEMKEQEELKPFIQKQYPEAEQIAFWLENHGLKEVVLPQPPPKGDMASPDEGYPPAASWKVIADPHQLAAIDVAVIQGSFGIAENAAIWIPESALPHRVLPFINQHLVILLDQQQFVWNMHEAYEKLGTDMPGFGMFLSGPSKTADIEQSLVKGAHGARSLLVVLY
jgi:L-lactate dehydrogenase complex protein LldG